MTKWIIYECDRCGKEMRHDAEGETKPHQLIMRHAGEEENDVKFDVCEDCLSTFNYFLEQSEEFDKLADKLCAKEQEEKEA